MCEDKFNKSEEYSKTRGSFDELGVEEQAAFIVESAVNMIVKSVQKAGDAFSKAFDDMKMDGGDDADGESDAAKKPAPKKKKPAAKKSTAKSSKAKSNAKSKSE